MWTDAGKSEVEGGEEGSSKDLELLCKEQQQMIAQVYPCSIWELAALCRWGGLGTALPTHARQPWPESFPP